MQAPPPLRTLDIHEAAPAAAPAGPQALAQLGAWRTRAKAEATLRAVQAAAPSPPPLRVAPVTLRGRLWWRVVAGPMPAGAAADMCRRLGSATPCWIRSLKLGGDRGSP